MAKIRLGPGGTKKIEEEIDKLFDKLKVRFLGPGSVQSRIHVTYERPKGLAGIYEAAAKEGGETPDKETFKSLTNIADNYIEAARLRAKSKILSEIQGKLAEAAAQGGMDAAAFRVILNESMIKIMHEATSNVRQIVEVEVNTAKNVSIYDAISKVNAKHGIDDPTVYFIVVHDEALCDECKKLHLMPDEITPRLWYQSEVQHGYHKRRVNAPSIHGLHPSCRCTIVTLMPGWGFVNGNLKFVDFGHQEIKKQRGEDD